MTTPALPTGRTIVRVPNLKGNDRKTLRRGSVYNIICIAFCICVSSIVLARILRLGLSDIYGNATSIDHRYYERNRADIISQRVDRTDSGGASFHGQKVRRRKKRRGFSPDMDESSSNGQKNVIHTDKEKEDMILSGKVHLVSLSIQTQKLKEKNYGYGAVIGHFCTIDWPLYKKNPTTCKLLHAIVFK